MVRSTRSAKGNPMARSFFGRTDAELLAGSMAFVDTISADPELYGLSAEIAAEYRALNDIYAACYQIAIAPGTRTKSTVCDKNDARARLREMASALARQISGTPGITKAQKAGLGLSVPDAPAAVSTLGKPDQLSIQLQCDGALRLKWKCTNPRATGTVYKISRRIKPPVGDGKMVFLGISGKRKFVDA